MSNKLGHSMDNWNKLKWINNRHPCQLKKSIFWGAILELPAKQHCQFQPKNGPNGLNWQCFLAVSSITAPRILISLMTMVADSFELISIETCAPQFIGHNKLFLGSVIWLAATRSFMLWRTKWIGTNRKLRYYIVVHWWLGYLVGK